MKEIKINDIIKNDHGLFLNYKKTTNGKLVVNLSKTIENALFANNQENY
jgi:hypothetical protein